MCTHQQYSVMSHKNAILAAMLNLRIDMLNNEMFNEIMFILLSSSAVLSWIAIFCLYAKRNQNSQNAPALSLICCKDSGEIYTQIELSDKSAVLIGKGGAKENVDLDLSMVANCQNIANQHAVLNCVDGQWYIESLDKANRVGLKKSGEDMAYRLKVVAQYKIAAGDTIYIAQQKIFVR